MNNQPTKNTKVKVEKKPVAKKLKQKASVELISFSVKATIPTQMYGNIIPEIVVKAVDIETARKTVMPVIEDLYQAYADEPINGKQPKFFNKASVQVTEKVVDTKSLESVTNKVKDKALEASEVKEVEKTAPAESDSEAYAKAKNAILSASTIDAINLVAQKITSSVKITDYEKKLLNSFVENRIREINTRNSVA